MFKYAEQELEDSLRRAFVDNHANYIIINDRRARFLCESATFGVLKGWLEGKWHEADEQSSWIEYRLTSEGRRYFGLA